jgi:hypothetical protein
MQTLVRRMLVVYAFCSEDAKREERACESQADISALADYVKSSARMELEIVRCFGERRR